MPPPEEIARELETIDAALRGEAVDPACAELAELALLLADARPALSPRGAVALDRRIGALDPGARPVWRPSRSPRRPWFLRPAYGAGLALVLVLAVLVLVLPRGGGSGAISSSNSISSSSGSSAGGRAQASASHAASSAPARSAAGSSSAAGTFTPPTPQSNGRRVIQSAQLQLTAPAARIASVAQELFDVVGSEAGIVKHSEVSSGTGGYASFTLSIPTANLSATLTRLAQLRYARVSSSTASTSDVNNDYLNDRRALSDANTLRRTLLAQLAAATTTPVADLLRTKIAAVERRIAAAERTLTSLAAQIAYSAVSVQITAGAAPALPVAAGGGGFGLGQAAHDALRVLVLAAGVLLIVLAVLLPLAVLFGIGLWLIGAWRRRRRRRVLDAA